MSNKSAQKKLSVPRDMAAINAEYGQLCAQAGQLQYTIKINNETLDSLNHRIKGINNEAAARQKLDAQTQVSKATEEAHAANPLTTTPTEQPTQPVVS